MENYLSNEVNALEKGDLGGGPRFNPEIFEALNGDPAQLIYELLQNADDAGADKVIFRLTEDRLDIHHNGANFEYGDIRGVVDFGYSNKGQVDSIGRFGIGFKSVYRITSTPHIFSGKYNVKIVNWEPKNATPNDDKELKTLIRLTFDRTDLAKGEAFQIISRKLKGLEAKTLLFLRKIKKVEWTIISSNGEHSNGEHSKTSGSKKLRSKNTSNVTAISNVRLNSPQGTHEYIVFRKLFEDTRFFVEVAFRLERGKNNKKKIVAEKNVKLVVFFSTTEVTSLNFVVHGPYKTNLSRETVNLKDVPINKRIIAETGELVAESLPIIRDLGYLNTDFLRLLPISTAIDNPIYSCVHNKIGEKLITEELLPTLEGSKKRYANPADSAIGTNALSELLLPEDLKKLYFGKYLKKGKVWLDTNITGDLKTYLTSDELGVKDVDLDGFVEKITEPEHRLFLQSRRDKWIVKFYRELSKHEKLWKKREHSPWVVPTRPILWDAPIIKLDDEEYIAPFNGEGEPRKDEPQVYLPLSPKAGYKSRYPTIKASLARDKDIIEFLENLGLKTPGIQAEVKNRVLPRYRDGKGTKNEQYYSDFLSIMKARDVTPGNRIDRFIDDLKSIPFILTVNNVTGEFVFKTPGETYIKSDALEEFFKGHESTYFVAGELLEKDKDGEILEFLEELGVKNRPRRVQVSGLLTEEEKRPMREGRYRCRGEQEVNYMYDGLENFIENGITPERSHLLWRLLLEDTRGSEFFQGTYRWTPQRNWRPWEDFPAQFLKTLRVSKWLGDKNGNLREPSDLTLSELSDDYEQKSWRASILIEQLQFKRELPPEKQKIIDLELENEDLKHKNEGLKQENDKLKKNLEKYEDKKSREKWKPEVKPDEAVIEKGKIELRELPTPDPHPGRGGGKRPEIIDNDEPDEPVIDGKDKKEIGKCGEESAYISLKQDYEELGITKEISINSDTIFEVAVSGKEKIKIVWHNKNEDTGRGHDICIKQSGKETKYIEVKSTTLEDPKTIDVQETQWKMAKEKGANYSFYVVSNVGKEVVKVGALDDPYGQWEAGTLRAHPVRIKLPKDIQDDQVHRLLVTDE